MIQPCVERCGRLRDHDHAHLRVLMTAILGALTVVDARLIRLEPGDVGLTRNSVGLPGELRHPERMNHILPGEAEPDRLADRNMQLVCGREAALRRLCVVARFPPPLMTGDV